MRSRRDTTNATEERLISLSREVEVLKHDLRQVDSEGGNQSDVLAMCLALMRKEEELANCRMLCLELKYEENASNNDDKTYEYLELIFGPDYLVTDMSYAYRLGCPFVEAAKSPMKAIFIPARLLILLFDVVTGIGRRKQRMAVERLSRASMHALEAHTEYIRMTAAYRLGGLILTIFSGNPKALTEFPAKIQQIYSDTST